MWVLIRVISYNFGGPKKVKHMCARERERERVDWFSCYGKKVIYLFLLLVANHQNCVCGFFFLIIIF